MTDRPFPATLVLVAVGLGPWACSSESDPSGAAAPPEIQLFAPGVISTEVPEFATTFSASGDTVWFSRTTADFSGLAILTSVRSNGTWSKPDTVLHFEDAPVADPFLSHDGQRLYFSALLAPEDGRPASWDTWFLERTGDGWSEPRNVGSPPNSDSVDIFVSETRDGELVFMSNRDGRKLYRAERGDGGWDEPVALAVPGTEGRNPGNPLIAPTGRALVFAMDAEGAGEEPSGDLFVTCRQAGGWSAPRALEPPINSPYTDFAPGLGPEGELYFTSQRPGVVGDVPEGDRRPGDLYRSSLEVERLCR